MINAVIIDDEAHCLDRLTRLLNQACSGKVSVAGTAHSVETGYELISRVNPDLVFLDIQLHEKSGFDLLSLFDNIDFEIIFCTGYHQYAIRAIQFSALDYLLKPIDVDLLIEAVDRLSARREKEQSKQNRALYEMARYNITYMHQRIGIPTLTGITMLEVKEIMRCESEDNYTHVFMISDRRKHTVTRTLKEFEEMLSPMGFIRVHNRHLVNIRYIKEYKKGKGGFVVLQNNEQIEVSERKKGDVLKALGKMTL